MAGRVPGENRAEAGCKGCEVIGVLVVLQGLGEGGEVGLAQCPPHCTHEQLRPLHLGTQSWLLLQTQPNPSRASRGGGSELEWMGRLSTLTPLKTAMLGSAGCLSCPSRYRYTCAHTGHWLPTGARTSLILFLPPLCRSASLFSHGRVKVEPGA